MKTKLFKRIGTLILACVMCLSFFTTAFAMEYSRDVTIGAGETVDIRMGFTESKTATVRVSSDSNWTRGTISWSVHKEGEPAFMSCTSNIGDSFSQGGIYLERGTYYVKVTNNSSRSVKVHITI